MMLSLIAWYVIGVLSCILLEYNDYKKGEATDLTAKTFIAIMLSSVLGAVLFLWALWYIYIKPIEIDLDKVIIKYPKKENKNEINKL